jgi:adenylate cyclase
MLSILVSGRTDRYRFVRRDGPLEFSRGTQREMPRSVLTDPAVSNNQFCIQECEDGQIELRNLKAGLHPARS